MDEGFLTESTAFRNGGDKMNFTEDSPQKASKAKRRSRHCCKCCGHDEVEFASNTTCHGLKRIASVKSCWRRALWIIVVLILFGFLLEELFGLIEDFGKYKSTTSISIESNGTIDFPAITICDSNRLNRSALTEIGIPPSDSELINYILFGFGNFGWFGRLFLKNESYDGQMKARYTNYTGRPWDYSYVIEKTAKKDFSKNILGCFIVGHDEAATLAPEDTIGCDAREYYRTTWTKDGECATFNHPDIGKSFSQKTPGGEHGMTILWDLRQFEYSENLDGNMQAGLSIYLHPRYEPGELVTAYGTALSPGTYAIGALKLDKKTNLPKPYGNCAEKKLRYEDRYSLAGCELECEADIIANNCQCRPLFTSSYRRNIRVCEPYDVKMCMMPLLNNADYITAFKSCYNSCGTACKEEIYDINLSFSSFPNRHAADALQTALNLSANYVRDNIIYLNLYYPRLSYTSFNQEKATTRSQLISDFGGMMGLCVGASVLTVCEFIEFAFVKIFKWCCSKSEDDYIADEDAIQEKPGVNDRGGVELTSKISSVI
ncbi:bile acid-sensitive ion channel-like [Tubulanus polymorphus]|uniref:bile acid-sensitive ion channel-like n=1 Tax=Tubulanus polymorphus TaxID=672921 RepID=UPI003DA2FAB0